MDLLKVTPANFVFNPDGGYDEPWKPSMVIEGYDSLIWTERYQPAGDFELKTSTNIEQMLIDLPLGSFVSLMDSLEVMYVETHSIGKDADGLTTLTVTGRTIESFLENRTTVMPGTTASSINILSPPPYTLDILSVMIDNQIDSKETGIFIDTNMAFNMGSDLSLSYTSVARARQIPRGNTYEEVLKILAEDNLGIKNYRCRPFKGSYQVPDGLDPYGLIIYNGDDKRSTVIFDVKAGHVENTKYLMSVRGYKTSVYVASQNGGVQVSASGTANNTGFNRRIYNLDATDITTAAGATLTAQLTARGRADLATKKKTILFEGDISPQNPYRYGPHGRFGVTLDVGGGVEYEIGNPASPDYLGGDYYLGDLVRVVGEYGVIQDMYVTEYVRIEDSTGERGYPSLSLPDEI